MVELTDEEYAEFKKLTCKHEAPGYAKCYCCGNIHHYTCTKCGTDVNVSDDCHDPENSLYPYCGLCN